MDARDGVDGWWVWRHVNKAEGMFARLKWNFVEGDELNRVCGGLRM